MTAELFNHEVFAKDPRVSKLPNDGVAEVKGRPDAAIIAEELGMFVCEGQYTKGLDLVLQAFVNNVERDKQPAAWISGFYGSGKSHLVKVLRYLWTNEPLADGRTPRDIAHLPSEIRDLLKELDTVGKRAGGLFAAAGVMAAAPADQLPKSILSIIYEALALPSDKTTADFVRWLRRKGLEAKVKADIEAAGFNFDDEIADFRVSTDIANSLRKHDPAYGTTADSVLDKLNAEFRPNSSLDIDEMVKSIQGALTERFKGSMPCTLLVIDEAQQSLGLDSDRSFTFEKCVEALSSRFNGRLIVVATGQSMLSAGTANLPKLQDRFSVKLHLQDNDIESVIRKVVLQKRSDRKAAVQDLINASEGEITRQLQGTGFETTATDKDRYVDDYPVLPVRQRFWEKALRNIDTGLTGQLRTQLRITHDAVANVANSPLGVVIPADQLYDQLAAGLVEKGALDRERHNTIQRLRSSANADEQLAGRLYALIFMIGKINHETRDKPGDLGIRATPAVLADLLVEDLRSGSTALRERIPRILAVHETKGNLLRVGEEYRLQTPESAAWEQHYRQRLTGLTNNDGEIAFLRSELFRREIGGMINDVPLIHGKAKIKRQHSVSFTDTPPPADQGVPVWVRTEWDVSVKNATNDAHAAGVHSPRVTVLIPKAGKQDELKQLLAEAKAAELTLQERSAPATAAGIEARDAIQSRKILAEQGARELLLQHILRDVRVILAGSEEFNGITFTDKLRGACEASLARLYPSFSIADSDRWEEVFKQAKSGAGSPLQLLNFSDDPDKHPVCKAILDEVGAGKKGSDLVKKFTGAQYGWSNNAVNAAIMVLLAAGLLRAARNGQPIARQAIEQSTIGPTEFRVDHPPIAVGDRLKLRAIFQKAGVKCPTNDDVANKAGEFLQQALKLAAAAGGDAPLPAPPSTAPIKELQALFGNEQLSAILAAHDTLTADLDRWSKRAALSASRTPRWSSLLTLLNHAEAGGLPEAVDVRAQVDAIIEHRQLLDPTDPVPPLASTLSTSLRAHVSKVATQAAAVHEQHAATIAADPNWKALGEQNLAARETLASTHRLAPPPELAIAAEDELLASLSSRSIASWMELAAAIPGRFDAARRDAAKALEPKAQSIKLPSATIKSKDDLAAWLRSAEAAISAKLGDGPVII
jgi:hypothetical protein